MGTQSRLHALRQAIDEMVDEGADLARVAAGIIDAVPDLDAERRAALWLYARSRAESIAAGRTNDTGRVHASGRPSEGGSATEREGSQKLYVTCANCGLTSYALGSRSQRGECPGCGEPLRSDRPSPTTPAVERDSSSGVGGALALAQLDMDVALLTEIAAGAEVVRQTAGEWAPIGSLVGASLPLGETFCNRLLEGRIPNFIADAERDERVQDLDMASELGIGAWIGVPLTPSDARLYMLCCLAREARPALGEEEVRFLRGLGETMLSDLEHAGWS